jgi:Tfp pilus assembly protein PilO
MFSKKTSTRAIIKNLLRAIASVCVASFIVYITSAQITATTNSIAEKKTASLFLQKRSQALADLRLELTEVGANDAKLARALPPDDNISEFLSTLKGLADKNSLQSSVQVSPPTSLFQKGAVAVSGISYTVTLNGTVVTLERYLEGFEALPYFSGISSINITSPSGWEGNSSVSLGATLYARQVNL